MYTQNFMPLSNIGLSALVAAIPILFFFVALIVLKMKAYVAGTLTTIIAILLAAFVYGMPAQIGIMAAVHGVLFGLFPIGWIVLMAVFLYNITLHTGQFEIIKKSISSITDDRRLQVLLISFCFGAFLEGAAGFGTPVAITAAILIGLGFDAKYAACMCLLANTAPVAYGGLGIPAIVGAQVAGMDVNVVSKQLAFIIPVLGIIVPFYLIAVMAGIKGMMEVLPPIIVCAVSFSVSMFLTTYFLGPILPDIVASIVSLICVAAFLKVWHPKKVWRFKNDPAVVENKEKLSIKEVVYAWSPFIILIIFIGDWGVKSVKHILGQVTVSFNIPLLEKAVIVPGVTPVKYMPAIYHFDWLAAAGTAIFFAALFAALIAKMSMSDFFRLLGKTCKDLKWSLATIASVLAFADVGNYAGMTTTLGRAVASTGAFFPFLAAIIGWIGVFVTGSDTAANALFGKLQTTAWGSIGSVPVLGLGANLCGGGVGKMISPQSIAIAAAATGLEGREGELYRFSLRHSITLLLVLCLWMLFLYYAGSAHNFASIFVVHDSTAIVTKAKDVVSATTGAVTLAISIVVIGILGAWVNSRKSA